MDAPIVDFSGVSAAIVGSIAALTTVGLAIWGPKLLARYGKGFISIFTR